MNAVFTVTLDGASSQDVTVEYVTADLTRDEAYWNNGSPATAGVDYTALAGTLTIPAGQTTGFINVPVIGDRVGEDTELFSLYLVDSTNAIIVSNHAMAMIIDDEPVVGFTFPASSEVVEGPSGTTPMTFTIELSAPSDVTVTVDYLTAAGTADGSSDFLPVAGTVTFAPGQVTQTLTVQILGDTRAEGYEYFLVFLREAKNANLGSSLAHGYIMDDDTIPSISISNGTVYEGDSGTTEMIFTVALSQASQKKVQVKYATADRTAKTGDGDYVAQSGTITFKPGETSKTITISIKGDKKKESDEYFFVNLSGASGAPIEVGKGEGWIYNDDDTPKPKKSKSQAQLYDAALAELVVGNSGKRRK